MKSYFLAQNSDFFLSIWNTQKPYGELLVGYIVLSNAN